MASAWAGYEDENDPPGCVVHRNGSAVVWEVEGTDGFPHEAYDRLSTTRARAWAWYWRRVDVSLALRQSRSGDLQWDFSADGSLVGTGAQLPRLTTDRWWPLCLAWSDDDVSAVERWHEQGGELPRVLRAPMARAVDRAASETLAVTAITPSSELQLAVSAAAHEAAAASFGRYMRDVRLKANVSLRDLAKALCLSHVFLSEVERGFRGLARQHWPRLLEMLPELDPLRLEHMARLRLPLRINVADKPASLQDVCILFAERVEAGKLTAEQIAAMRAILSKEGSE